MAPQLTPTPPHIVILGGGSAGWITACLLHKRWAERGVAITLVESQDIGIIGVGEGSTPELAAFFAALDIAESDWMPACDATYKYGIRFNGWSERAGYHSYFHPFPGPVDLHTQARFFQCCDLRRQGLDVPALPDDWFLATRLANARLAPHPDGNFPFPPTYGYHFDAHKLGRYLRQWATARGVRHLDAKVAHADVSPSGDIAALVTETGERIGGDFFVDCSGFRSMLIQDRLKTPFVSFADTLFSDRAVVMPTDHDRPWLPQTEASAMAAGWRWSIPLTSRVGNGYVYSSRYIDDAAAEAELRAALGDACRDAQARFLSMRVGRVSDSWVGNCLATGLAQGFIEPLEATALHICIATAREFADAFEEGGFSPRHRDAFNRRIADRYDGIRDYITAHYRLNQRSEGAYWQDCRANHDLSDKLKAMLTAWFTRGSIMTENHRSYGASAPYSPMSWYCLFAGYGTFPDDTKLAQLTAGDQAPELPSDFLAACARNFRPIETSTPRYVDPNLSGE